MDGARNPRKISASKESRLALLSKLREAKERGEKLRIEKKETAVYETVDEAEYARIVQQRLEDDWIVDDEGEGYADDGREIFDDNDEDEDLVERKRKEKAVSKSASASKKARLNPDIRASESAPMRPQVGRDIRSLFAATSAHQTTKKQKESVDAPVDPNLDDLLAELEYSTPKAAAAHQSATPVRARKQVVVDHIKLLPEEDKMLASLDRRTTDSASKDKANKGFNAKKYNLHLPDTISIADDVTPGSQLTPISRRRNPFSAPDVDLSSVTTSTKVSITNHDTAEKPSVLNSMDVSDVDFTDDFSTISHETLPSAANPNTSSELKPEPLACWLTAENEAASPFDTWTDQACSFGSTSDRSDKLHFFWLDAYEDVRQQPGVIFLFGKLRDSQSPVKFSSCCIRVKELERRIFLLPRPELIQPDGDTGSVLKSVYNEFRELSIAHKIGKFRCKSSTKLYAFEHADVPVESEYLEVRYAASCPALPSDLQGKTFSRVFGTTTSFLENFILELQLRGPCWLEIRNSASLQPQISWCHVDYEVTWSSGSSCPIAKLSTVLEKQQGNIKNDEDIKPTVVPPAPPLCLVSLNLKSVTQPHANHSEIVSIGLLIDQNYRLDRPTGKGGLFQSHYLVLCPPKDAALPYDLRTKLPTWGPQYAPPSSTWLNTLDVTQGKPSNYTSRMTTACSNIRGGGIDIEPNERALLGRFLTRLHRLDPDFLVGHDLWGHQIELLIQRLQANKVAHWHRIGRLRRSAHFTVQAGNRSWLIRHSLPGRLICDTRVSARELVHSRTYNLTDLANQVLSDFGPSGARRQVPPHVLRMLNGTDSDRVDSLSYEVADLEVDSADLRCLFATSDLVKQLIDFCLSDAHLVLRLAHQMQILPLAMQITSICGNVLSRTLSGGRAERNEALLLHAFTQRGYLVPDPPAIRRGRSNAVAFHEEWDGHGDPADDGTQVVGSSGRRKPTYTGGLVLEPKKGFYDKYILLLDFNSLYPSIIQEYNICFTTVDRHLITSGSKSSDLQASAVTTGHTSEAVDLETLVASLLSAAQGASTSSSTTEPDRIGRQLRLPTEQTPGLLPAEIRRLVESRREVKKLIAAATSGSGAPVDAAQLTQWNIRQTALKVTANSVYGCLGFAASRFCARGLAALVTGLGRAVLMNTRDLVENMNFEVIYGDTDSIMVNTNTTDLCAALSIGEKVRQEVNKHYRLLELDTDGVYASILLLAKKKYAALAICNPLQWASAFRAAQAKQLPISPPATKQEMKGLDIVRRDWSALAINIGRRCVSALLSGDPKDVILDRIHADLTETAEKVRQGKLPISEFVITKMLTKAPEDYTDVKSLPHVQVALRLNSHNQSNDKSTTNRRLKSGDTVEYVICDDQSGLSATQRGYSPAELVGRSSHKIKEETDQSTPSLALDVNYYLAHQIHPVVCRLVAPIEGTSPAHIADCLGLDPAGYRRQEANFPGAEDDDDAVGLTVVPGQAQSSLAAWGDVESFTLDCPRRCGGVPIEIKPSTLNPKTWICSNCSHNLLHSIDSVRHLVNRLTLRTRQLIIRYELGWMRCEDPACGLITRSIYCPLSGTGDSDGLWARGGRPLCPNCEGQALLKAQYPESRLYRQLRFFRHLIETALKTSVENHLNPTVDRVLTQSRSHYDRLLSRSAFAMVDLGHLFSGLRKVSTHVGPGVR